MSVQDPTSSSSSPFWAACHSFVHRLSPRVQLTVLPQRCFAAAVHSFGASQTMFTSLTASVQERRTWQDENRFMHALNGNTVASPRRIPCSSFPCATHQCYSVCPSFSSGAGVSLLDTAPTQGQEPCAPRAQRECCCGLWDSTHCLVILIFSRGFPQTYPRQLLFHQRKVLDVSLTIQLLRNAVLSQRRERLPPCSRRLADPAVLGAVVSVLLSIVMCLVISFAV